MADGDLYFFPEASGLPHPLGRAGVSHDPRNRQYAVRPLLAVERTRKPGPWWARHVFDQQGSSCTAQAATGLLLSSPFRLAKRWLPVQLAYGAERQRHDLYLEAQRHDPWPGGEPTYEGSSTDAPFRVLRNRGLIREWRWCFGVRDVQDTLAILGPVVVGTYWYDSMFGVDKRGYLRVDPNSGEAGGHAWLVLDYDHRDDEYLALNSWGRSWGVNGRMRVHGKDMRHLLERDGDAVTVVL